MKDILPVLVMIGTLMLCLGTFNYLRDCFQGKTEFNPVTWFAWTIAFFFQSSWIFVGQGQSVARLIAALILLFLIMMVLFSTGVFLFGLAFSPQERHWSQVPSIIIAITLIPLFFILMKRFQIPGLADLFSLASLIIGAIPLYREIKPAEEPFSGIPWVYWVAGFTSWAVCISFREGSSWLEIVCAWGYVVTFLYPLLFTFWIAVDSQGESPREPGSGWTGQ